MGDYAAYKTDVELAKLEKRIITLCNDSLKDIEQEIEDYFASFAERNKKMVEKLNNGEITADYYKQWRLNQIGRGERMEALRDKIAGRAANALQTATDYINDDIPKIYALNRNYTAYEISSYSKNIDFTLWDEHTVRRMLVEEPDLMPEYPEASARRRGIDLDFGKKKITASVTRGILLGKSVYKIADDLMKDVTDMERVSAIRAARTAYTTAQNSGRQDGYAEAASMGIKVRKRWLCTHDLRTRYSHGMMDWQTVPWDEPFSWGSDKLMFPGDQSLGASPAMIYNCRCTMCTVEKEGIEAEPRQTRVRNPITGQYEMVDAVPYKEWLQQQKDKDPVGFAEALSRMQAENRKKYKTRRESDQKLLNKERKSGIFSGVKASISAGTLPPKLKKYVPETALRKEIIQKGINAERPIYDSGILGRYAQYITPMDGYYDVVMHGRGYYVQFYDKIIDADTLCAIIAQREDYKKGTPIRLISCFTGAEDDGVASYIAEKLKVDVLAPTKEAIVSMPLNGKSRVTIANGGEFRKFPLEEEK